MSAFQPSLTVTVEEIRAPEESRGLLRMFGRKRGRVIGVKILIKGDLDANRDKLDNFSDALAGLDSGLAVTQTRTAAGIEYSIKVANPNARLQEEDVRAVVGKVREFLRAAQTSYSEYFKPLLKALARSTRVNPAAQQQAAPQQPAAPPRQPTAPPPDELPAAVAAEPPESQDAETLPTGYELLTVPFDRGFFAMANHIVQMIAALTDSAAFIRAVTYFKDEEHALLDEYSRAAISALMDNPSPDLKDQRYVDFVKMAVVALWLGAISDLTHKPEHALSGLAYQRLEETLEKIFTQIDAMLAKPAPTSEQDRDIREAAKRCAVFALEQAGNIIDVGFRADIRHERHATFFTDSWEHTAQGPLDLKEKIREKLDLLAADPNVPNRIRQR